jgi:hypothetical protein
VTAVVVPATTSCSQRDKKLAEYAAAMNAILASEPNVRLRALRDEVGRLAADGKMDDAAAKVEALPRAIDDLLQAMDKLHHKKTAVPSFEVTRYVESMRDLGENVRGFQRIWSPKNPPALKKEMLAGFLEQLRLKVR